MSLGYDEDEQEEQEHVDEQEHADEEEQFNNSCDIKRCEEFKKKTYNTFKTTMYNEGKNIKSKN